MNRQIIKYPPDLEKEMKTIREIFYNPKNLDQLIYAIQSPEFWKPVKNSKSMPSLVKKYKQEIKEYCDSISLNLPIPENKIEKRKLWKTLKSNIKERRNEGMRTSMIKAFSLPTNLNYKETIKAVENVLEGKSRERLGIGEDANLQLSELLNSSVTEAIKDVCGYVYMRVWVLPDGSKWYKIGLTNNPQRREAEQNVLPVPAETLYVARVASMDHARVIERVILEILEKDIIKGANNTELFKLNSKDVLSVLNLLKKLDIKN